MPEVFDVSGVSGDSLFLEWSLATSPSRRCQNLLLSIFFMISMSRALGPLIENNTVINSMRSFLFRVFSLIRNPTNAVQLTQLLITCFLDIVQAIVILYCSSWLLICFIYSCSKVRTQQFLNKHQHRTDHQCMKLNKVLGQHFFLKYSNIPLWNIPYCQTKQRAVL